MYYRPYRGIDSDENFLKYLKSHFIRTDDADVGASSVDEEWYAYH